METSLGLGEYVSAFSVVLGVYMFGVQGVLFGPVVVCGVKLLYELAGVIMLEYAGLETPVGAANGRGATSGFGSAVPSTTT